MSGDYSRVSFDPSMDIASVLMQQGRVQIDSDWNIWVAALDRRMRAEAVDTFGVHPSPDKSGVAVVSAHTPDAFKIGIAIGPGLYGEYFDGINLSNCKFTRTDATVNFDWGVGSPDPLIGTDNFSVRWSGSVLAPVTGNYTFHTVSDDGVRLWINNQLLIDNWTDHGATENSSSIALTAGQKYNIKLEYYEHLGVASIKLLWTPPGQAKQIIPQTQLFSPNINIGGGRMYVDGLLAENHGSGATEFDSVLAELRGKDPLFYNNQPYLPNPPAMLASGATHLAYLEVWQREATHHQLPDIVEKAVGVETTTRVQTVWQVRFLGDDAAGADCSTPDNAVPGWANLVRPSGGRMSIQTGVVNTSTDPCELPVGGGYRGLENQLYRIEIHDGGGLGMATFKWSRENASVESNVMEIITNTKNKLKLASLGRDEVLRFSKDDWVEILDDVRELGGEGGDRTKRRGEMRKITDIDEANLTITLSSDLPGDLIADKATLALHHTRVRRWDQKGEVRYADNTICVADLNTTGGLIPVPNNGKWVVLEKNVQVQFSLDPAGGDFHSSDYWLSAARTSDASVEAFTSAPPRGIHHHYARLAMVTFPLQVGVDIPDCRIHWPPECGGCCTIIVSPEEPIGRIQQAIDSLPKEGGCVCLKTGTHKINKTITIKSPNIALRGEGPGAIVYSKDLDVFLEVVEATSIIVEGIRFEAEYGNAMDVSTPKLLSLQDCRQVQVAHCSLAVLDNANSVRAVGILAETATDISVTSNHMEGVFRGILTKDDMGKLHIADNTIAGDASFIKKAESPLENCGISVKPKRTPSCVIENNRISQFHVGIHAWSPAQEAVIAENQISCSGGGTGGITLTPQGLRSYLESCPYAIIAEATLCEVRDNRITLDTTGGGGISASGEHTIVAENILSSASNAEKLPSMSHAIIPAIYCHGVADHASVRNNTLTGPQSGIIVSCIDAPIVSGNRIDSIEENQRAWYGVIVDDCTDARIENNGISNVRCGVLLDLGVGNRVMGNRIGTVMLGIFSWNETSLEASGNTLQSCASIGMFLIARGATAVLNNRVSNCGYVGGISCGIFALSEEVLSFVDAGANLRIENCEITDTGISPDATQVTGVGAVGIAALAVACQITGNRVGYVQPDKLEAQLEHRALSLIGPLSVVYSLASGNFGYESGSALVSDNHFRGPGKSALVEFMRKEIGTELLKIMLRFERITFSNNICDHLYAKEGKPIPATVKLYGGDVIVMGNHVKGDKAVRSIESYGEKIVLLGNITTGDYHGIPAVPPIATPGTYGDHNIKLN